MIPNYDELHLGRSFSGHLLEDDCPCPQEACGLVSGRRASPDCDQHGLGSTKTMRQIHVEGKCPVSTRADVESNLAAAGMGTYVLVSGWVIVKQHQETWSWVNTRDSINTHDADTSTQSVVSAIMYYKETEQYYTVNYAQESEPG